MREDIHEIQAKQMEWMELDDIDRLAVVHMKKNSSAAKAEALFAIAKSLKQQTATPYQARLKGIAQGMIRTCFLFDVFNKEECDCLLNMLTK